jgi:PAS domain S-box-containing protein
MKIKHKLVAGLTIVVLLVVAVGIVSLRQLYRIAQPLRQDIPEAVAEAARLKRQDSLSQLIRYYDEVRTQSARNFAFTHDPQWQQRYQDAEPRLDDAIKEVLRNSAEKDRELFARIDQANLALVVMEHASLRLAGAGQAGEAVALLDSRAYADQKDVYRKGLTDYAQKSGHEYDDARDASTERVQAADRLAQSIVRAGISSMFGGVAAALLLSAATGLIVFRSISRPLEQLRRATEAIGRGNLETNIEVDSDGEMGQLAASFRDMAANLRTTTASLDSLNREIAERRQAQAKLLESEEKFRVLFEASSDAIMIIEPPAWRFTSGNPATIKMFQAKDEAEFVTKGPWDVSPEFQPDGVRSDDKAKAMIMKAMQEGSHFFEWDHMRLDGEVFPATILLTRVTLGEKVFLQGTVRDMTVVKRAEEAIQASESRYRALFDHSPDGVLIAGIGTKCFTHANPSICRMLGYTREELRVLGVADIHPQDQLPHVIAEFEALGRGEKTLAPSIPCLRKDGTVFYTDVSAVTVVLDGIACNVGFFRDITERQRAEEQIRQDSQIQSALNGLLRLSLEDLTTEQVLQQSIDHMISLPWFGASKGAIFLADDQQETLVMAAQRGLPTPLLTTCVRVPFGGCICGKAALSGQIEFADCVNERHENTFDGICPHGHYAVPILSSGKVLGVINTYVKEGHQRSQKEEDFLQAAAAVLAGVIERKRADNQIRQNSEIQATFNKLLGLSLEDLTMEEILRQAIDHITSAAGFALESKGAMFLVDDKQKTLVMAAQRGMGAPLLTLCARVPFGRCTCGRAALSREVEFVDCVDERHENTFEGIHPHGHYCVPILSGGKVLGVINTYVKEGHVRCQEEEEFLRAAAAVLAGVIERKKAEEQKTQLLRKLAEINQELKDFAYVVSHDLKAPLRAIKALAEWLSTDYQDKLDEQGKENLQLLGSRVDRMQGLIDGVLQYSRVGRTEEGTAPVDLRQIVPEIVENLGVPEHISIRIEPDLPTVEGDVTRITQVFQNLLSNAIKYMDKPQGCITVGCVEEDGLWKFSVSDNGPGIEQKHFDRIFKLFQTLAPREGSESTGVGLTITKKIVEMYGGKIWVESEVGQGSTFFFTLPRQRMEVSDAKVRIDAACTV